MRAGQPQRGMTRPTPSAWKGGPTAYDCQARGCTLREIREMGCSVSGIRDYSTWAFLLLTVGVTLLIAEVFIPSGGIISVLSTLSLIGAIVCAWQAWWGTSQGSFWGFLAGMAVILPLAIATAFYVWPSTPIG